MTADLIPCAALLPLPDKACPPKSCRLAGDLRVRALLAFVVVLIMNLQVRDVLPDWIAAAKVALLRGGKLRKLSHALQFPVPLRLLVSLALAQSCEMPDF
ncbi:hypothetical protein [Roseateles oligotrophus]|uniref:hypothetical protein n=1 Tax=Roseateles oligotrophus TaxID=1769250 RepID=UPI0021E504EA|nr:hypothetical protein [Roseateles oligotrophus]